MSNRNDIIELKANYKTTIRTNHHTIEYLSTDVLVDDSTGLIKLIWETANGQKYPVEVLLKDYISSYVYRIKERILYAPINQEEFSPVIYMRKVDDNE